MGGSTPVEPDLFLDLKGIRKEFGGFTALQSIDLGIRKGEFVCFLGPSGCGKTTLLRAIAGLDPQTSGTIHQKGRDVSALLASEAIAGTTVATTMMAAA